MTVGEISPGCSKGTLDGASWTMTANLDWEDMVCIPVVELSEDDEDDDNDSEDNDDEADCDGLDIGDNADRDDDIDRDDNVDRDNKVVGRLLWAGIVNFGREGVNDDGMVWVLLESVGLGGLFRTLSAFFLLWVRGREPMEGCL